ncbi:RNA degradosome polyphosphate kinase [Spirochaetia bacterium]|nr:RNA degradosome polyphosphate kinase [Spirochaetia bacterium]
MNTVCYFNRELSWIDFNRRVLEEGLRKDLPPLERFRFLSIVSSNFDEFFMIRIAAIKQAIHSGKQTADISGLSLDKQLKLASSKIRTIFAELYRCLQEEILPALALGGIAIIRPQFYSAAQRSYLESLFMSEIFPVLTPLRINSEERLPSIESPFLYVAFLLSTKESVLNGTSDEDELISIVRIPKNLDRLIELPPSGAERQPAKWAFLEDLILTWGGNLYAGYVIKERMLFKVNRDADFSVDEKRDEDFIEAMEEVLVNRESSMPVRLISTPDAPKLREELRRRLNLDALDLYEIEGPFRLDGIYAKIKDLDPSKTDIDALMEKPWKISASPAFPREESLWDRIRESDVLLHFPYESFDPVVRFFQEAAADPAVLSIKTALYRTSGNSPIINALEEASLAGKQVTAMVELKARFDEERNISWANRLEKAGVIVIYGLARLKVHAKIAMVMRRESNRIKRYVHLSTGNYNDGTAKIYEDLCLFTAQEEIGYDASLFFNMITGYSVILETRRLTIAPSGLKRRIIELINREADRSSQEYPGCIMAKMNALADIDIIDALYAASRAGVKIMLCVRGICQLVPGIAGLSENIRVISIIDHYLEHSRILYFANGGAEELFLSSADWMPRNMEKRIELLFPILDDNLKARLRRFLAAYFKDNCHARVLASSGVWKLKSSPTEEQRFRVQKYFLSEAIRSAETQSTVLQEFVVRRSPQRPVEGCGV